MKHALKQEYQKNLIILLHRCVCFTLATFLLHKFCSVNVVRSMRKTFYELNRKPSSGENILTRLNMAEERLAEAVRKYPVLYDKSDKYFKDKNKKLLAWEDVAQDAHFENGELVFFKCIFDFNLYACVTCIEFLPKKSQISFFILWYSEMN